MCSGGVVSGRASVGGVSAGGGGEAVMELDRRSPGQGGYRVWVERGGGRSLGGKHCGRLSGGEWAGCGDIESIGGNCRGDDCCCCCRCCKIWKQMRFHQELAWFRGAGGGSGCGSEGCRLEVVYLSTDRFLLYHDPNLGLPVRGGWSFG